MKGIALSLALSLIMGLSMAQDGNNICVWNALNTYKGGGGPEDLERGIKCSDEAAVNEATVNKAKTWFYRGQLYTSVFLDKKLKEQYPNAAFEATKAFKRLSEINDPKFKDWEDVYGYLGPLGVNIFNAGVERFQAKDYANAYLYFYAIKDVNSALDTKEKKSTLDLSVALKNAAIAAENAGDMENAIKVYKEWMTISTEPTPYKLYAKALKKAGKKDEARAVVDEALVKYPKDAGLLVEKINFYLDESKYVDALGYVNSLLEVDSKNDNATFIKALAFEKMGKEDSMLYYYDVTTQLNPKNGDAWNNLGAYYVNKANTMLDEMNKLSNSAADIKKYEELKKQRKDYYLKGKPYLEKAKELNPNDATLTRTLKQIDAYTAE